jgi:hypothetical protein
MHAFFEKSVTTTSPQKAGIMHFRNIFDRFFHLSLSHFHPQEKGRQSIDTVYTIKKWTKSLHQGIVRVYPVKLQVERLLHVLLM